MADRPKDTQKGPTRTAGEAGWHVSRYNLTAPIPDTKMVCIVNLYKGVCAEYTPIECYLLSVVEELDEHHPIIERFAKRGVIANFDERAALETMGRTACAAPRTINLTICPTMGCNFDCPYCFEDHGRGKMSAEVQDDVMALVERMLNASHAKDVAVTWFGGEPLLAQDVIMSLSARLIALTEEHGGTYHASIVTNGYLLTQDVVDMLDSVRVKSAQVTIDGVGDTHDATRHLVGGGATFDRITSNLRNCKIPFQVRIRHNVHEANKSDMDRLSDLIERLAEESGNDLIYYAAPVSGSEAADERGRQVDLLCATSESEVGIRQEAGRFRAGRGNYCGAQVFWSIAIDERGNLQKCWESVDKTALSFGTAHDWDPNNPLLTASNLDNLTKFLNTANLVGDEECLECVWLPMCVGGCPYRRLFARRACLAFRNEPEPYVLALHERLVKEREKSEEDPGTEEG